MSKCCKEFSCPTMHTLMTDGNFHYTESIMISETEGPYIGIFAKGKTIVVDNHEYIDSTIIQHCPGCGVRLSDFIDCYAPPLLKEKSKPSLVIV